MIDCYCCQVSYPNRRTYIDHLKACLFIGKIKYPLKCSFEGCQQEEFYNFRVLNDHLRIQHQEQINQKQNQTKIGKQKTINRSELIESTETYSTVLNEIITNSSDMSSNQISYNDNDELINIKKIDFNKLINGNFSKVLEDNLLRMILELKSNLALSDSLFNNIYEAFVDLITLILNHVCILLKHTEIEPETLFKLVKEIQMYQEQFKSFDSSYKQLKLISQQRNYVKPETKHYDSRLERVYNNESSEFVVKKDSFGYISILETLKRLLNDDQYCLTIKKNEHNDKLRPMYDDLIPFWKKENTLKILLFHDEIELANPLGDASCVYKLDNYYFKILNLGNKHNSMLKNIHCIASAFSSDIKNNGNDPILRSIVNEIKVLETEGVKINDKTFYGSIYQVSGDNLGIHQIFGLKEGFCGENICHLCDGSTESFQSKFKEIDYSPITKQSYNEIIEELNEGQAKMVQGVKKYCLLNDLKYYHHTNNYAFDITHDLYEGIVPLHIKLILREFIKTKKYFSLEILNERILNFNYGNVDKANKPSPIRTANNKLIIKEKAAKMRCLFRCFPLLIGDKIPIDNDHWKLFTKLIKIANLAESEELTYKKIYELENLIQKFLSDFKLTYPNETLKKKHHNLVHYPKSIRMLGNLIDFSTLRFEAKHSMFKTASNSTYNYRNIIKTVLRKHQILNCYNLSYQSLLNLDYEILKSREIDLDSIDNQSKLLVSQVINNSYPIFIRDNLVIKVFGTKLTNNMSMLFDVNGTKLVGKIANIYEIQNRIFFYVNVLKLDSYDSHYCAYKVTNSEAFCLFNIEQINNYHPFNDYYCLDFVNSSKFVLPYFDFIFM
jgi:hypothetical protein